MIIEVERGLLGSKRIGEKRSFWYENTVCAVASSD